MVSHWFDRETGTGLTVQGVESPSSGLMTNDEEDSMSELYQSLSHSKWDCKYHVVFVPKRRRKAIFGQTRRQLGQIFHGLPTERMADYRRSPNARPCPHVHRDSDEASGRSCGGVPEREERDRRCPAEREGAEFLRGAFLGS